MVYFELNAFVDAVLRYIEFLRPDVRWTIAYVIFFLWMYLFHAPFRVHSNCRTDWYAQVTKVLQAWFGLVVLFFHAGPRFFLSRRCLKSETDVVKEGAVASVFFPTFTSSTLIILYAHKKKREWGLGLTYGPTVTIVLLNALLLSLFSTVHYGYCVQMSERDQPSWLKHILPVMCPEPTTQAPFLTLMLLSILNVLFIVLDYHYKKWHGFDPVRGLLWSERFGLKRNGADLSSSRKRHSDSQKRLPSVGQTRKEKSKKKRSSEARPRRRFESLQEKMQLSLISLYPVDRPGMVPWFSTFIAGTALQAALGSMLNFLTFDQRSVELHAAPKVFYLSFVDQLLNPSSRKSGADASKSDSAASTSAEVIPSITQDSDVWFDFVGDVGDGFNSTYEMARLMAQPFLELTTHGRRNVKRTGWQSYERFRYASPEGRGPLSLSFLNAPNLLAHARNERSGPVSVMLDDYKPVQFHSLPRGSFVIIGGDLAYPNPTDETYRTRLLEPYNDALPGCKGLRSLMRQRHQDVVVQCKEERDYAHITMLSATRVAAMVRRGGLTSGEHSDELIMRSVPLLFAIPGNHDWLDGLVTFKKYIVEERWLGGWFMPQRSSFFILALPYNWFFFCGDTGTTVDIDAAQRNYFLEFIDTHLDDNSCVILTCHEPAWIYEALHKELTHPSQPQLNKVIKALGTRLRLHICGDIHHYSRHTPADALSEAPTLIVSGGGGAFLHGARNDRIVSHGTEYRRSAAFPPTNKLTTIFSRIFGFRIINWKFDVIAGFMCFGLIVSSLPLNIRDNSVQDVADKAQFVVCVASLTLELFLFTFNNAVLSLVFVVFFFLLFFSAGANQRGLFFRVVYAVLWTGVVVLSSTGVLALVHTTLVYMSNNRMLLSTKGHWGSMMEVQVRSASGALLDHTQRLFNDNHAISKMIQTIRLVAPESLPVKSFCVLLRSLDVVENLAYLSYHVSEDVTGSFSGSTNRLYIFLYLLHLLLIYWLVATPIVSFIIGLFLFVSVHFFDMAYDAAYSSFQIEDYKHFVRFRIDRKTRELHGYVITEKCVPRLWVHDAKHYTSFSNTDVENLPPHLRKRPSWWKPLMAHEAASIPEVLEHFVVKPHRGTGLLVRQTMQRSRSHH